MRKIGKKTKLGLLLRLAFLAVCLFVLLRIVNIELVIEHIMAIPLTILAILVIVALLRTWLTGLRWQLVNPDVTSLNSWQYFRLVMMAKPFNLVMPGALGGDFVRAAFTIKEVKTNHWANVIGIVVDRFIGLLSITILGGISLVFMSDLPDKKPFYNSFIVLFFVFGATVITGSMPLILNQFEKLFSRMGNSGTKLHNALTSWSAAMRFFIQNPLRLLGSLAICVPIHGLSFLTTYVMASVLNIQISFIDICVVQSLVWIITAVPISISGTGLRELSMIYFLSLFGVEPEPATVLSIYLYIVTVLLGFIGLILVALNKPLKNLGR